MLKIVGNAIDSDRCLKKAINSSDVQLLSLFQINATERINFVIDVIFTKEHRCLTLDLHRGLRDCKLVVQSVHFVCLVPQALFISSMIIICCKNILIKFLKKESIFTQNKVNQNQY